MQNLTSVPSPPTFPLSSQEVLHLLQSSPTGIPPTLDHPPLPPVSAPTPWTSQSPSAFSPPAQGAFRVTLLILSLGLGLVLLIGQLAVHRQPASPAPVPTLALALLPSPSVGKNTQASGEQTTPLPLAPTATSGPPVAAVLPTLPLPPPTVPPSIQPTSDENTWTIYMVVSGDNLAGIAERLGRSPQAIAAANNLSNPNLIRAGQVLNIPPRAWTISVAAPPSVPQPQMPVRGQPASTAASLPTPTAPPPALPSATAIVTPPAAGGSGAWGNDWLDPAIQQREATAIAAPPAP